MSIKAYSKKDNIYTRGFAEVKTPFAQRWGGHHQLIEVSEKKNKR